MSVEVMEYKKEMISDGCIVRSVQLLSVRDQKKIPIQYESEGVKKILSILSILISIYHNSAVCLVVDELDSGIFEYLLGELLEVIQKYGKGQLIFTSHNLRPLEKITKDSICFSTMNPMNRFVRIPQRKSQFNYRTSYLRLVDLGGLEEEIYDSSNNYEIAYAFKKAGELFESE